MVFLVFLEGFCIHHRPGKFFFEARKFSKRFSFGGGCVRFFLSSVWLAGATPDFCLTPIFCLQGRPRHGCCRGLLLQGW